MIKDSTIEEVMGLVKVEDVVQDFVTLNRRGVNMIGLCPFHNEKTPSFVVSTRKNIYKCFGCGKAGGAIQFLKDHSGFSFPEAIGYLADKYGVMVERVESSIEETLARQRKDSLYLVNQFAEEYFQSVETDHFKEFSEEIVKKFGLGFSDGGLTRMAINNGFSLNSLKELGLADSRGRDFFINQPIFTIHNKSGKPVAFVGEVCVYSPEIYNKGRVLYGFCFAKKAIQQKDECILVERYMDVILLHQAGVENVVAATSLTIDQVRLIKRYTSNVKVFFSGDLDYRGIDLILEQDFNVKVVFLPDGVRSIGAFEDLSSRDFIFFKVDILLKDFSIEGVRGLIKTLKKIPDLIKRWFYVQECAKLLDIRKEVLGGEVPYYTRVEGKTPQDDLMIISEHIKKAIEEIGRLSAAGDEKKLLLTMKVYSKLISIREQITNKVII